MFPVRYELRCSIPEDGILHSNRREGLKSYTVKHNTKQIANSNNKDGTKAPAEQYEMNCKREIIRDHWDRRNNGLNIITGLTPHIQEMAESPMRDNIQ
jgi:membrane peptidoglycan carboxypeptidase